MLSTSQQSGMRRGGENKRGVGVGEIERETEKKGTEKQRHHMTKRHALSNPYSTSTRLSYISLSYKITKRLVLEMLVY